MLRRCCLRRIPPSAAYQKQISIGKVKSDDMQVAALHQLDRVYRDVHNFYRSPDARKPRDLFQKPSLVTGMIPTQVFDYENKMKQAHGSEHAPTLHPLSKVKGLYLHGGVGCGKTHIMDILYEQIPTKKKQRVHFNQFMNDVHKTVQEIKRGNFGTKRGMNDIDATAVRLLTDAEVLCFDEMVVADIADAMILRRLFQSFYRIGLVAVFTSNRPPDDLYKGGLNRESFLPFIRMLKEHCVVHDMRCSTDYRLTGSHAEVYFHPLNSSAEEKFQQTWHDLSKGQRTSAKVLKVFGRDVVVPRAVAGVCFFSFAELCGAEMSSADYGVIAQNFHTIFLSHVPRMYRHETNPKRRFISLLDELYQYRCKLVVLAESSPDELEIPDAVLDGNKTVTNADMCELGQLIDTGDDSFQMARAKSRMQEMRTVQYLQSPHLGKPTQEDGDN